MGVVKMKNESVESDLNSQWIYSQGIPTKKRKQEKKMAEQEDKIGKETSSAAAIAKKHDVPLAQVHMQIAKGVKVEREHTKSDAEAAEIARDHLDEFPDYYDRLHKMENQAKKDMSESATHRVRLEYGHQDGDSRTYEVKAKDTSDAVEKAIRAHHKQTGWTYHTKDMLRNNAYVDKLKEDVANSVGGGNIAGMPTADTPDTSVARPLGSMQRRKKFAGKTVFVVDPTTFHKAYLGKRKYEHYEKYLEGCDIAEEIRQYGRTYWDEPIIIQNEQTGAMVYLKYGSKWWNC